MQINGREISSKLPPYIIAEISGNHGGSLDRAMALIHAAKEAGADAVKLQCFEAGRITLNCDKPEFILREGPWAGRKLYDLYKATETPRAWFPELFLHARKREITIFSSVFSPEDVDFLQTLDCPAYKIASFEANDTPLIAYAAKTGKPLIISTGMATYGEVDKAADIVVAAQNIEPLFLKCISGYPTPIEEASLPKHFGRMAPGWHGLGPDGISDHTLGWEVPVATTTLGATIIEKHLKLLDGPRTEDSDFSMNELDFGSMCGRVRAIWQAMQPSEHKSEESSRQARRSLYVVEDIKAGERFTSKNIRSIRPAYGMPPKELPHVLKSYAACDLERGTALQEGHLMPF